MSNIEWTDATWNPTVGCTPVSPGCLNCYAATMARRLEGMGAKGYEPRWEDGLGESVATLIEPSRQCRGIDDDRIIRIAEVKGGRAVFTGEARCLPDRLEVPLRWKKPRLVFVNSMSDLFHEAVPLDFVARVVAVMWEARRHTFQVLTKRAERMSRLLNDRAFWKRVRGWLKGNHLQCVDGPEIDDSVETLPNVWWGVSVEDQARADERIPHLLRCPAAVRFLSVEPMLGPVDLTRIAWRSGRTVIDVDCLNAVATSRLLGDSHQCEKDSAVHWVICGGESGPGARPFDIAWARSLRDQCEAAGVPFFMKQVGSEPLLEDHSYCRACMKWDHADEWNLVNKSVTNHEALDGVLEHSCGKVQRTYTGAPQRLNDPKGGDMAEWTSDLRVREMPA